MQKSQQTAITLGIN